MTVQEARTAAEAIRDKVRAGGDPHGEKVEARQEVKKAAEVEAFTVAKLGERFIKNFRGKPRSKEYYESILRVHVLPRVGDRPAASITRADVVALHEDLTATASPVTANRSLAVLSSAFSYGIRATSELAEAIHPVRGLQIKHKEKGKEVFLERDQLAALLAMVEKAEKDGIESTFDNRGFKQTIVYQIPSAAADAIRLLALTGARLREVIELRWSEVDLKNRVVMLGEDRSKAGARAIHIGGAALAILQARQKARRDGEGYVFPTAEGGKPLPDLKRPWAAITKAMGLTGLRLHDLRHSYVSLAVTAGGLSLFEAGALVGHRNPQTTARYAHLADGRRAAGAAAMDALITDPNP